LKREEKGEKCWEQPRASGRLHRWFGKKRDVKRKKVGTTETRTKPGNPLTIKEGREIQGQGKLH